MAEPELGQIAQEPLLLESLLLVATVGNYADLQRAYNLALFKMFIVSRLIPYFGF